MIHAPEKLLALLPDDIDDDIYIVSRYPEKFIPKAKYILCTNNPEKLTHAQVNKLYDIWPGKLTPSLVKFFSERLRTAPLQELARQDYLTGLSNRYYLNEYLSAHEHEKITCICIDLDNFKPINDTYGHHEGDRALMITAEYMQNIFPDGFCARIGGDEFMIVFTGDYDLQDIVKRTDEFIAGLEALPDIKGLSASAGVSCNEGQDLEGMMHQADKALYRAKKNGRRHCECYY